MLLLSAADEVDQVMVALCINLATNSANAQQMADSSRLQSLMTRAFNYQDSLLMKMIHNISEHDPIRSSFIVSLNSPPMRHLYSRNFVFIAYNSTKLLIFSV